MYVPEPPIDRTVLACERSVTFDSVIDTAVPDPDADSAAPSAATPEYDGPPPFAHTMDVYSAATTFVIAMEAVSAATHIETPHAATATYGNGPPAAEMVLLLPATIVVDVSVAVATYELATDTPRLAATANEPPVVRQADDVTFAAFAIMLTLFTLAHALPEIDNDTMPHAATALS